MERLVEDLRRLEPVDYRTGEVPSEPSLTHDERLHLSRRTADRRLASARVKLGAESTTEAVIAFSRASGW